MAAHNMETLVAWAKRRGFVFQSAALYGGLQGVYDFGPLGVELKQHLKARWWRDMVRYRGDVEGMDTSILTHREILHYSGHEETFTDPMVDCRVCQLRWRADHITGHCPSCSSTDLTDPRPFQLMLQTHLGPLADDGARAYLRPETAQGIFTNFKNVLESTSRVLPFGIAQIGKAFRNEITPRHFVFRVREFEQMELEFFVRPGEDEEWHRYWVQERYRWWIEQGLSSERLLSQAQHPDSLSHYSKATTDLLYAFAHGLEELEGIANRTDYDLASHSKEAFSFSPSSAIHENRHSTHKLVVRDQEGKVFFPYVIEPSCGVDRGVLAILTESWVHEQAAVDRIVLRIAPHLAPIKAAVLPLAKNQSAQCVMAERLVHDLRRKLPGRVAFENTGNVGKSYRRHDEIGTPVCITVDFESVEDHTVTVRDRDTMQQVRVALDAVALYCSEHYFSDA